MRMRVVWASGSAEVDAAVRCKGGFRVLADT
jgi:hypothetical protein